MSASGPVRPGTRRRWTLRLIVVLLVGALGVIALLTAVAVHAPQHLPRIEAFVKAVRPWAIGLQLLCIGLLWLRWARFVHWLATSGRISEAEVGPLLRARHRLTVMLLAIVLVLGARLPFLLLAPSTGG